jgi:hypothetical protein
MSYVLCLSISKRGNVSYIVGGLDNDTRPETKFMNVQFNRGFWALILRVLRK